MEVWKWVWKCVCEGVETLMVSKFDGYAADQLSSEVWGVWKVWKCESVEGAEVCEMWKYGR